MPALKRGEVAKKSCMGSCFGGGGTMKKDITALFYWPWGRIAVLLDAGRIGSLIFEGVCRGGDGEWRL